ncbi:MAG: tRNA (adenosine(37)-N6)-threonylcarbamoyltransferase complex ATPase subunit type 1 TsaE [Tannerellaceae bacterium]|jgi:tRNA threonylcarbamoyladenosine biosynthesis protein TsaE|nr:tRNA (adenosine(37)-N6)-threonylcarbamoyltransferase complex ATPase subunit type 1 TsaE [Tannerellaceae bacterium]
MTFDLAHIRQAARSFIPMTEEHRVIAFHAAMGAGKTTFIKALCQELSVRDEAVNSPSFAIINEYRTATGERIYHFDFYRLNDPAEAVDLDLAGYFDSGDLCLIEWPDMITACLPPGTAHVSIEENADGTRTLQLSDL